MKIISSLVSSFLIVLGFTRLSDLIDPNVEKLAAASYDDDASSNSDI